MQPFTVFDIIGDHVIWCGDVCSECHEAIPDRSQINRTEIIIRFYLNGNDQLVCILYHAECWYRLMTMLKNLGGTFQ